MKKLIEKMKDPDSGLEYGHQYNADGVRLAQACARNFNGLFDHFRGYDIVDVLRIVKGELMVVSMDRMTNEDNLRYQSEEHLCL